MTDSKQQLEGGNERSMSGCNMMGSGLGNGAAGEVTDSCNGELKDVSDAYPMVHGL